MICVARTADLQDIFRRAGRRNGTRWRRTARTEIAGVEDDQHVGMRPHERIDIECRLRVIGSRRIHRYGSALPIAPRIRMDTRALTIGLLKNRREIDRTSDSGTLRAEVAADVAGVLDDELGAGSDGVAVVVRDRRGAVTDRRGGGMRSVALVVPGVGGIRIIAAGGSGKLVT